MRLNLDRSWSERLRDLPESGMGYQRVRVRLKDGRTVDDAIAVNAQILDIPDGIPTFTSSDIAARRVFERTEW